MSGRRPPDAAGEGAGLEALEERLDHGFEDPTLLETALLHSSWAHDAGQGRGNERLEFLGDAVLDLVVAELLYDAHPGWEEGELTRTRAGLVNRDALAHCARLLELGSFVPELRLPISHHKSSPFQ